MYNCYTSFPKGAHGKIDEDGMNKSYTAGEKGGVGHCARNDADESKNAS